MQQALDLQRVRQWVQAHRRPLSVGLLGTLAGLAATAFGVAPLAPDAANLPRQVITETLRPHVDLPGQLEALSDFPLELFRSDITRRQDTVDSLLARLGISDAPAAAFIRRDPTARRLLEGRAEKMVRAKADSQGRLTELVARYPADPRLPQSDKLFTRLTIALEDGRWVSRVETAELTPQVRLGSGTVSSSFFSSADEAGVPDAVAAQMAEVFSGDVDFHRELKRGDTFSLVYETLTADGEPINWNQSAGRVLAAEFVNNGRVHQAVWFEQGGRGAYYDLKGNSKQRAFLASPMAFSRVTSGFAMRFHPVHRRMMAHTGVDYAAPTGTPARTVGEGVVDFAGWKPEYGNTVIVRHAADKTTWYAHLSRIDVRRGERVQQGQRIGAVGATGTATGPHLHFEFRVRDRYVDPAKVMRSAQAAPVGEAARGAFAGQVELYRAKLEVAATLVGTSDQGD